MWWMTPGVMAETEEKPKPPTVPPFACILKGADTTYCGRAPSIREFTFGRDGASYTSRMYDRRKTKKPVCWTGVEACISCCDEIDRLEKLDGEARAK